MSPKKISPHRAGRGASPGDGPGRTGPKSSRRDGKKSTTPGDKLAGSPARVMRRLQQRGEQFYKDIEKL